MSTIIGIRSSNVQGVLYLFASVLYYTLFLSACHQSPFDNIDDDAISNKEQVENWLAYGRTHSEQRFSPTTDINVSNIDKLKVDWYIDLPGDVGLVSTPLVAHGVLYFVGTMNVVRAVDATSGDLIWEFDPEVADYLGTNQWLGRIHSRGLSLYKGKVFVATFDGRLIALDAKTGTELWTAVTFDLGEPLYITGAPKAFRDKVLIGNGGSENGASRGYVTAYDAETGEQAWRFYIVPGNPADGFENEAMRLAAETWTGEWWKLGGGGHAWHGFTYDDDLDILYIGTGNGSPWNQKIRSPEGGDNLFLSSIVALDPDTGEYLWHYQTTPGESWDFNSTMDIVLADLTIDGEAIKALLHAPKNGFFYVINRETGTLISAEPFVETTWASHIDLDSGRPVEIPGARYETGQATVTPTIAGAHSWQAMSFNPETGLVYIPAMHLAARYTDVSIDLENWQQRSFVRNDGVDIDWGVEQPRNYYGSLLAWDPVEQIEVWSVSLSHYWNAGTLTTAGNLVFQGRADGVFLAYDARTGEELWSFDAGLGISAPPISYKIDGRQYIALLVGWGGNSTAGDRASGWAYGVHTRRLIAFSIDGNATVPEQPPPFFPEPIQDSTFIIDRDLASRGAIEFVVCGMCHGSGAVSGGMAPDLRASAIPLHLESFASVVRDGARLSRGMPAFAHLTDEDLTALMHYIRQQAEAN